MRRMPARSKYPDEGKSFDEDEDQDHCDDGIYIPGISTKRLAEVKSHNSPSPSKWNRRAI